MYIIPFSAEHKKKKKAAAGARSQRRRLGFVEIEREEKKSGESGSKRTGKGFGHFCGDDPEPGEVRLVSDEHGDDVWVRVPAQLFDPSFDVAEGRQSRDVEH